MQDHSWLVEVVEDLRRYVEVNDLKGDLPDAIVEAAAAAQRALPTVQTEFVPMLKLVE